MSTTRRAILLSVCLAFLAGVGGAFVGAKFLAPNTPQDNALHELLHSKLNLSPDQERDISTEENRFARARAHREAIIRKANVKLARAIQATKRDGPEVQMAIEHIHVALGEYQKETVSHIFRMRAVLTSEQAEIFDRSVSQALMQEQR